MDQNFPSVIQTILYNLESEKPNIEMVQTQSNNIPKQIKAKPKRILFSLLASLK